MARTLVAVPSTDPEPPAASGGTAPDCPGGYRWTCSRRAASEIEPDTEGYTV
ncbi:MAG: hypothetical protein MOP51_1273 [Citricoccus sp.]|nr:hypothetical protein [Citricoccus sp. WCRC_4]